MSKHIGPSLMKMSFIALLFATFFNVSFSQGIRFEQDTTLAAVMAKARKANKPVFIDYYFTGCTPCKWMERAVFPNDTVGEFFNANFVSVKLNLDKGDGKKVAARYNVYGGPTYLFLDTAGNEMHRFGWAMPAKEFLINAKKAFDPQNRFAALQERFKNGERDPAFLCKYVMGLRMAADTGAAKMSDWYFSSVPEIALLTKENFDLMEKTISSMRQPGFEKLLKHYKALGKLAGRERVNAKISELYTGVFDEVYIYNQEKQRMEVNESRYAEIVEKIKALGYDGKEDIIAIESLRYHYMRRDHLAYITAAKIYVPEYFWNDPWKLDSHADKFYRMTDKKEELETALAWSKRSLEMNDDQYTIFTCAAICQKLGRKNEALQYAQKAYGLAKEAGYGLEMFEGLIETINKMK